MNGLLGKMLDDIYRVDLVLGRGGMGTVYRARDVALDRDVAIKVMHSHFADDKDFAARFLQEARAIASLDHPGIVKVYAFGHDLGLLYIVMDYIPGQTLQAWLQRLAGEHKIVALTESLAIIQQVALALHYAHEKGILHRDIKPANILLKPPDPVLRDPGDPPFRPVLTDFGLAKLAEGGVHTLTGTTMGTPAYMSPEQCLGVELSRHTDVYSLGVVLFELTTGRVPFEVKSLTEAIRRHTREPPPPPRSINSSLPAEVENIILRALAKRPQDRFATSRDLADALRTAIPAVPADLTVVPTLAQTPAPSAPEPPTSYASLMTRLEDEAAEPPTVTAPPPPGIQIDVFVGTPELSVVPGDHTTASITVFNRGAAAGRFRVSVEGIPADWMPTPAPALQLLPGTHQEVRLTIRPPRRPSSQAGRHKLEVRVTSPDAPDRVAVASATLTVATYTQFRCELSPRRLQAGKPAQVRIENQGNASRAFAVTWQDQENELVFEPSQAQLTVAAGQAAAVPFRAAPRQSRWIGGARTHAFSVRVRPPQQEARRADGEVVSSGLIPLWAPLVMLFACLLLVGVAALVAGPRLFSTATSTPAATLPPDTPTAEPTTEPTSPPTRPPSPTPQGASPTPPAPTETPTPEHVGMAWIPAGSFIRGSTEGQIQDAYDACTQDDSLCSLKGMEDELPRHNAYVDAFYIDEHEVTNAEYVECVQDGICAPPAPTSSNTRETYLDDPAYADYPVIHVTWHDADTFCRWAEKRLPTEAEWEKAARGTDGLLWPWGNSFAPDRARFRPGSAAPDSGDTGPVDSHPGGSSPYGALDMVGNVWEWVADWYAPSYGEPPATENPKGPPQGEQRAIRGGSWNSNIASARAASRAGAPPGERFFDIGFRCAQ